MTILSLQHSNVKPEFNLKNARKLLKVIILDAFLGLKKVKPLWDVKRLK